MHCKACKAELERRFDEGEPLEPGLEAHLTACAACRVRAGQLQLLSAALDSLSPIAAKAGLAAKIRAELPAERGGLDAGWIYAAAVAAVVVSAGIIGWFYPLGWKPSTWAASAAQWREGWEAAYREATAFNLQHIGQQVLDTTGTIAAAALGWGGHALELAGGISWWFVGAAAAVLIGFNGFAALELRHAYTVGLRNRVRRSK